MMKLHVLLLLSLLLSCQSKDRTEIENRGKYRMEKVYKDDILVSSTTFVEELLVWSAEYSDGKLHKGVEYYPDQKVRAVYELTMAPNHFTEIMYRNNGKIKSKGECDHIKDSDMFLKRGATIYYTENGKISEIMLFENNTKEEFLIRHALMDTLHEVKVFDKVYNPPLSIDEFNSGLRE